MEIELLAIVKTKDAFQRFKPYVKEHVLSKEASLVFNTIESYFKFNPEVKELEWEKFESHFFTLRSSQIRKETAEFYRTIFKKLKAHTPSSSTDEVLKHYVTQDYSTRIADAALKVREGTATIDDVAALVQTCDKELGRAIKPTDLFVTGGVGAVLALASEPGFNWRLGELNISLGPIRKGDFLIVTAYVETGKTTFVADQVSHMATQITDERPVVWINNEERSDKVLLRVQQAALGMTLADIRKDPKAAEEAYEKMMHMKNRILILNNDSGMNSANKLTPLFRDLNPALIVFDQLDKVGGFWKQDEGEHARLGRLYAWGREMCHEHGPVLAVSQTDASGSTSQYIGMEQLRGSKVDKPGEADAIITIGKSNDPKLAYKRYIHIPKNKLFGGPLSLESERHGYWEVDIRPEIARYEGTR